MKITKEFMTETAHRLQTHPGRCKNIHGHSYKWAVTLGSNQLQLNGMLEDFSDLKKTVGPIIDEFDHALVLEENDPWISAFMSLPQRLMLYSCPPTAENMAFHVCRKIAARYPNCSVTVKVWETVTASAEYTIERG